LIRFLFYKDAAPMGLLLRVADPHSGGIRVHLRNLRFKK